MENVKRGIILLECTYLDQVRRGRIPNRRNIGEKELQTREQSMWFVVKIQMVQTVVMIILMSLSMSIPIKMHTDNHLPAREVTCQIDTGSTCSVIGFNDLCKVHQDGAPKLKESHAKLRFYDGSILKPIGKCQIHSNWKTNSVDLEFQVVDVRRKVLLLAEASQLLGLVTIHIKDEGDKVNNMEAFWNGKPPMPSLDKEAILKDYGDTLNDLGCLPGKYHIETEPTVKSSQNPLQRVPVATKSAIKKKINEMLKEGILANVSEPTDWISNMVAAKKSNGDLRICIDPSHKAIRCPRYAMPMIEDVLPKLTKAKIFTGLDTKNGYWQVQRKEGKQESSYLTTMWTPCGRVRWLRMPFGIKSASEEFQHRMFEIFGDLPGTDVIADDILVFGSGETMEEAMADHDSNLIRFGKDVKFKKEKMKLRQDSVRYMGHLLTADGLKADPEKVKAVVNIPKPANVKGAQRLVGFVNYLAKFLPQLSTVCEPL